MQKVLKGFCTQIASQVAKFLPFKSLDWKFKSQMWLLGQRGQRGVIQQVHAERKGSKLHMKKGRTPSCLEFKLKCLYSF